jgi:hypothetical protein
MKKITSLLFAGIIAMAFASVADAATAVRTAAPKVVNQKVVNQSNRTYDYTTSSTVNLGTFNAASEGWYSSWYNQSRGNLYSTAYSGVSYVTNGLSNRFGSGWSVTYNSVSRGLSYTSYAVTYHGTKTVDNRVTTTTVDKSVNNNSTIEYAMIDGVLTPVVRNTVTQNNVTTTVKTGDLTTYTATVTANAEPITLDTTNTGKITTARNEWLMHSPTFYSEYASKFDFTGDGIADNCEWLSDNPDALLCMPVKGQINGVTELFGNLGGYANGFDKLSVLCDKDGNGIVEGSELEGLMLWVDSNRNGIADAGELKTLESYGITKFYTEHKNFVGKYETSDGQTHTMWAWFPSLQQ